MGGSPGRRAGRYFSGGLMEYLNTKKCGEMIDRSPGAVRNLVMRKAIPFRKPGGRLVFLRSEIEKWIESAPGVRLEQIKKDDA